MEPREIEIVMRSTKIVEAEDDVAPPSAREISLVRFVFSCMVAGGVQYCWALQFSLLTPYIQTLGLSHTLSSLIWVCGPISGFVVQPIVGLYSDKCKLQFGRRRPFILVGCLLVCCALILIGFSADIGYAMGDTKEHCSTYHGPRWKAAITFVIGFWILDFVNNGVQAPARALMADLSGQYGCNAANAIFVSWMSFGSILGYSSGSTGKWQNWFPFLNTRACCGACANLKGAFLVAVLFLLICMTVTIIAAKEVPLSKLTEKGEAISETEFLDIFRSIKKLPREMYYVLLINALTSFSFSSYILFGTDWMGREIYHGDPKGTVAQVNAFDTGVRAGAFSSVLSAIVQGVSSLILQPLCRKFTPRLVWVSSNLFMCINMATISIISVWSMHKYIGGVGDLVIRPDSNVKAAALVLSALHGFPSAVLFSVPFAFTASIAASHGIGQGLCNGFLNISMVISQLIVSLGAGPFDGIFGQGNIPAFVVSSVFAFICGCIGFFILPKRSI